MSVVLELQRELLKTDGDIVNQLQKALFISTKLNLRKLKKWVRCELDGYIDVDVPDYRMLTGKPTVMNPFRGPMPLIIQDVQFARKINIAPMGDSVSAIQNLLRSEGDTIRCLFEPGIRNYMMSLMTPKNMEPYLVIGKHHLEDILNKVKTELLEWTLKLENDGIIGEDLSFTVNEKKIAERDEDKLTPTVVLNFIGSMSNSQLQQFSPHGKQFTE